MSSIGDKVMKCKMWKAKKTGFSHLFKFRVSSLQFSKYYYAILFHRIAPSGQKSVNVLINKVKISF